MKPNAPESEGTPPLDSPRPDASSARYFPSTPVLVVGGLVLLVLMSFFVVKMALPGIVGGGLRAADASAVSRLRTLLWAQDTLRSQKWMDRDGDGLGEFGFLHQLAAQVPTSKGSVLPTPLLYGALSNIVSGSGQAVLVSGGFCHVIYLPSSQGGTPEPAGGIEPSGSVDADKAEKHWIAYAWPLDINKSGRKVFFINQDEEIWESRNTAPGQGYSGLTNIPAFDAALPQPDLSTVPKEGQPHGDGGVWTRWKGKKARATEQ